MLYPCTPTQISPYPNTFESHSYMVVKKKRPYLTAKTFYPPYLCRVFTSDVLQRPSYSEPYFNLTISFTSYMGTTQLPTRLPKVPFRRTR